MSLPLWERGSNVKILMINVVCGAGSTGRICTDLATELEKRGHEVKIAYGRGAVPEKYKKYAVRIGSEFDVRLHAIKARLFDAAGFGSRRATERFIEWVKEYDPDIIHLHNIHGYYINIEVLFRYLRSCGKKIVWTLHDCWPFTGHCAYFTTAKCEKWKDGCNKCPEKRSYPSSCFIDNSKQNYRRKKVAFTGIKDMTLIMPSQWLAGLVKQSFLREYPIEVHYNTINRDIFKPTPSNFRKTHGLNGKIVILGVAQGWSKRKGLQDFIELSRMLDDNYAIVLVGLTQKQIDNLPKNIIGLKRTENLEELASIYTMADVFVNPSKEETFGLTTIEAEACGTKAIVYKGTACEEIVNKFGGMAADENVDALYRAVISL